MSYDLIGWTPEVTKLSAANFAHMDQGIADAHSRLDDGAQPVVTSLPASPVDGQEIRFLADALNGIVWSLRYRAVAAGAYKWEFIGGSPLFSWTDTDETVANTSNSIVDLGGPLATVLPLAGDYHVEVDVILQAPASNVQTNVWIFTGANGSGGANLIASEPWIGTGPYGSKVEIRARLNALAAGTIRLRASTNGGSINWIRKSFKVTPVRVG